MIGDFLHKYKSEKEYFKEQTFTLFEVANYLLENEYMVEKVDVISKFMKKVKVLHNLSEGHDKLA